MGGAGTAVKRTPKFLGKSVWDKQPFGQIPDAEIAARLDVALATVKYQRKKRGVEGYKRFKAKRTAVAEVQREAEARAQAERDRAALPSPAALRSWTLQIPETLARDLEDMADAAGLSRSVFLVGVLGEVAERGPRPRVRP